MRRKTNKIAGLVRSPVKHREALWYNCTYLHRVRLAIVVITVVELGEEVFTHLRGERKQRVCSEHFLSIDNWFIRTGTDTNTLTRWITHLSNVLRHSIACTHFLHHRWDLCNITLRYGELGVRLVWSRDANFQLSWLEESRIWCLFHPDSGNLPTRKTRDFSGILQPWCGGNSICCIPEGWFLPGLSSPVCPSWCRPSQIRSGHKQIYRRCIPRRHGAASPHQCPCTPAAGQQSWCPWAVERQLSIVSQVTFHIDHLEYSVL